MLLVVGVRGGLGGQVCVEGGVGGQFCVEGGVGVCWVCVCVWGVCLFGFWCVVVGVGRRVLVRASGWCGSV